MRSISIATAGNSTIDVTLNVAMDPKLSCLFVLRSRRCYKALIHTHTLTPRPPPPPPPQLIRVNTPDLVLFVGEALVGNEAVDQLVKFNRALVDQAGDREARIIDGILLTKFDTIDDKVRLFC